MPYEGIVAQTCCHTVSDHSTRLLFHLLILFVLGSINGSLHVPGAAERSSHGVVTAALQGLLLPSWDILLLLVVVVVGMLVFMLVLCEDGGDVRLEENKDK